MNKGWIKLWRKLADWEWYDDIPATRLLVHLLVHVNYEDKNWKGHLIRAGSMAFSWETLSDKSGLSVRQCRTAMKKLEDSGEATRYVAGKFQVVSLVKWEELQSDEREATGNRSGQRQDDDRQSTTTKESKELNKLRSIIDTIDSDKKEIFEEWIDYRKKIKKTIKNEKTMQRLVDRFNSEPLEKCTWVVNHSIDAQYQGLFWEKFRGGNNYSSNSGDYTGSNR